MTFSIQNRGSLAAQGALWAAFLLMISQPSLTVSQAAKALLLWYRLVVPTLLPLLIVSGLIVAAKAWEPLDFLFRPLFGTLFGTPPCAGFVILLGILCGYPMGAKIASDLYRKSALSSRQAKHLLAFSCFPSPMFLTGFVIRQCLNAPSLLLPFLTAVYGSAFAIGFFYPRILPLRSQPNRRDAALASASIPEASNAPTERSFFVLQQTLLSSARLLVLAGLYMMLAMISAGFLEQFFRLLCPLSIKRFLPLITGLLEMTSGISLLSDSPLSPSSSALTAAFLCCFGGISVALQTSAVLPQEPGWIAHYLIWRLAHAALAVFLLRLIFFLIG